MKKLISLALALVLILSLSVTAFAAEAPTQLTKNYEIVGTGSSPAETFEFEHLTCTQVRFGGTLSNGNVIDANYVNTNGLYPTIGTAVYNAGDAGSANKTKTISVTLPTYPAVGEYTYTFNEKDNGTAGVTYRSETIRLVVTVTQGEDGRVQVYSVHTEAENGEKTGSFNNTYSSGELAVTKTVTGNMGDREKEFIVTVTFTAPDGDTVKSDITYTKGTTTNHVTFANGSNTATAVITLKHGETITFTNIPYGVTYSVTENDYTSDGYDAARYTYPDNNKKIDSEKDTVTITNTKVASVDTGITLDSLPFVLILAVCAGAVVLFVIKRRNSVEF